MRRIIPAVVAGALALGFGTASAQTSMTLRDRLVVVGSSSSASLTGLLTRSFTERHAGVLPPIVQSLGSARALELFCTGVGPQTPDIVVSTRRMPHAMVESCNGNGVRDIVELQIGYGAVVIAARRGEAAPALTSRQVWTALAAEQPRNDEFVPNRARLWSDVAPGLPRTDIRMILPAQDSGTHVLFDDLVMEAGCRQVKEIRLIFEANYRRAKCVTDRTDGVVRIVPAAEVPAALMAATPGTLAVMTYDQLVASGGNFVAVSLDGTVPNARTIANEDYDQVRVFYLYAKRQHSRNQSGVGVVRGIHEFLDEATSEGAGGPGGWDGYQTARDTLQKEASGLYMLALSVDTFSGVEFAPARGEMRSAIRGYASTVVSSDWPAMQAGTPSQASDTAFQRLTRTFLDLNGETPGQQALQQKIGDWLGGVAEARIARLSVTSRSLAGLIWMLVLTVSVSVIAFQWFFGGGNAAMHFAMGSVIAVIVGLVLLVSLKLAFPYAGDHALLTPRPFLALMEVQ